jgi:hypothetical protein
VDADVPIVVTDDTSVTADEVAVKVLRPDTRFGCPV